MGSGFLFALRGAATAQSHTGEPKCFISTRSDRWCASCVRRFLTAAPAGSGIYEVTRLMPADETGEVSYRIRSGVTERAVRESEIRA